MCILACDLWLLTFVKKSTQVVNYTTVIHEIQKHKGYVLLFGNKYLQTPNM